jgi:hypothetical protein
MIRFALKCENDHRFESWFQSGGAFETLSARGLVECPSCGATRISKDLMAPKVTASRKKADTPTKAMTTAPDPDVADAIKKLKDHVEANSDYVGQDFAREARAMHAGDTPERAIYGEVKSDEAKKLVEDGVPALPLPFIPRQKTN